MAGAWSFLVGNFAKTEGDVAVFSEALKEIQKETRRHYAADHPKDMVRVGWYCWQCRRLNRTACRSDAVPMYAAAEVAEEIREDLDD